MNARSTYGVRPLQTDGFCASQFGARRFLAALLLTLSATALAQQPSLPLAPGEPVPDDYYRAEFVILERIVEPEAVNEQMAGRKPQPPTDTEEVLWSLRQDGSAETTLQLAPRRDLHLARAAERLERSGRYRVLATAGWYEAFPPDYEGTPLRIEIGDWLTGANTREVEGHITIDRQRYLHVEVHLNHWQLAETGAATAEPQTGPDTAADAAPDGAVDPEADQSAAAEGLPGASAPMAEAAPVELLTWIRETRRMRSEEIHFLDSPTIGVLVFFKKIEARD